MVDRHRRRPGLERSDGCRPQGRVRPRDVLRRLDLAKLFAAGVYRLLRKTDLDNRLAEKLGINLLLEDREKKPGDEDALERGISLAVFYLLMALVVVAVLDFAGLEQTAAPIEGLVNKVFEQLPVVGTAILILAVAYIAALVLRKVVVRTLQAARFDVRMAKLDVSTDAEAAAKTTDAADKAEKADKAGKDEPRSFSETIGQVVFWLVMMLGLAGAFDKLQIEAISGPADQRHQHAHGPAADRRHRGADRDWWLHPVEDSSARS